MPLITAPILRKIFVFIALLTLAGPLIHSQEPPTRQIPFQQIGISDGLSQGMVNSILQDHYGFMWFATKDGLDRYDGYRFTVYQHDPEDSTSVADSYVQTMIEDSKGRFWIGTSYGDLDIFDQATGRFEHVIGSVITSRDAETGSVLQIVESPDAAIWVLYANQIRVVRVNESAGKPVYSISTIEIPARSVISYLYIAKNGETWFTDCINPIVYKYDHPSGKWTKDPAINCLLGSGTEGCSSSENDNETGILFRIFKDESRKEYTAISTKGILRWSADTKPRFIQKRPLPLFAACLFDREKRLWFADQNKIGILNDRMQMTFLAAARKEEKEVLIIAGTIYEDRSGMVWIGSKGYGILTLNDQALQFHHTDKTSIFSITESVDGKVRINNGSGKDRVVEIETGQYTDSIKRENAKVYFENFNEFSNPSFTDEKGWKWFADSKRLASYDPVSGKSNSYLLPIHTSITNYATVSDIKVSKAGEVWLATLEGVLCFQPKQGKWLQYKHDPKDMQSLSFNVLFSLCFDPVEPEKYLWVGTNGGGLNRMDMTTGKCIRYSVKDGLPNNVIYGILNDDDYNIWMSTNKGLSRFNVKTKSFKNFEDKDGLQSNEFNHNTYLRTSTGILFFGGINGFNYFHPREIVDNPVIPKIVITDFKIRNLSVPIGKPGSPLKAAVYESQEITLPYSEKMITFEFAALDFIAPKKNRYRYKMEGFDKDWVNSGNLNTATYTNLDPGTYTFTVKGSNNDGVWNEEGVSIKLTILPPWYMTWWFRVLVILAIIGLIWAIYRYRIKKALELLAVRNRIATDLHDEIGSNLSNISIFSNVAQQHVPSSGEAPGLLRKISEYTQISMEAMNDIVWIINPKNDRFENIMVRMRTHAAEIFEAAGSNLHIQFDEKLSNVKLTMEQRKNFYLIFKEAVNNVAKYAIAKDVWIEMELIGQQVRLSIRDNGIGFDAEKANHGNGIVNMKQRAALLNGLFQIDSKKGEGTSIALNFSN